MKKTIFMVCFRFTLYTCTIFIYIYIVNKTGLNCTLESAIMPLKQVMAIVSYLSCRDLTENLLTYIFGVWRRGVTRDFHG